jgi:hypothetical protein
MPSLVYISDNSDRLVFPLDRPVIKIGRGEQAHIHLPDESISRQHAVISCENGSFVLYNSSTNGTYVDGQLVQTQVLEDQNIVSLGSYSFRVHLYDASPVPQRSSLRVASPATDRIQPQPRLNSVAMRVSAPMIAPQPVAISVSPSLPRRVVRPKVRMQARGSIRSSLSFQPDYAFSSLLFGCTGLIAFLPAIVFGHLSTELEPRSRLYRQIGLTLGYASLAIWLLACIATFSNERSSRLISELFRSFWN